MVDRAAKMEFRARVVQPSDGHVGRVVLDVIDARSTEVVSSILRCLEPDGEVVVTITYTRSVR